MRKSNKRKKARTPYQTYKSWYENYSKNNVMKYDRLSYQDFRFAYKVMRESGQPNPARSLARDQMAFSTAQTRANIAALRKNHLDQKGQITLTKNFAYAFRDSKRAEWIKTHPGMEIDPFTEEEIDRQMRETLKQLLTDIKSGKGIRGIISNKKKAQLYFQYYVKALHDFYNLTYEEIYSPKES